MYWSDPQRDLRLECAWHSGGLESGERRFKLTANQCAAIQHEASSLVRKRSGSPDVRNQLDVRTWQRAASRVDDLSGDVGSQRGCGGTHRKQQQQGGNTVRADGCTQPPGAEEEHGGSSRRLARRKKTPPEDQVS